MNRDDMYAAMYRCLAVLHQEEPDEELGKFLMRINPYVLNGENAADPKQRKQFEKLMKKWMSTDEVSEDEGYQLVMRYLDDETEFGKVFRKLPVSDWISLCYILAQEKSMAVMRALGDIANGSGTKGAADTDIEALFNDPALMMQGMAGTGMSTSGGTSAYNSINTKKPVHPSKKKKKKKR